MKTEKACPTCGSVERFYTKEVAEAVLLKIEEIEFKTGRDPLEAFEHNNLPTFVKSDTVVLMRKDLMKFHDDFALMAAFLAHLFKTPNVAPAHLLAPLRAELNRRGEKTK